MSAADASPPFPSAIVRSADAAAMRAALDFAFVGRFIFIAPSKAIRTARLPSLLPKPLSCFAQRILAADADVLEKMVAAVGEFAERPALPSAGSPDVDKRRQTDRWRRAFGRGRDERRDGITAEWDESGRMVHGHGSFQAIERHGCSDRPAHGFSAVELQGAALGRNDRLTGGLRPLRL